MAMAATPQGSWTIVWLDARGARIVRWAEGPVIDEVPAEIPVHHRSTGHVRYDPSSRHGGSGPRAARDGRREEHLRAVLQAIADHLPPDESLELIGPGTLHARLAELVGQLDQRHGSTRQIESRHCGPMTDPQLIERLRLRLGRPAPRRQVRI